MFERRRIFQLSVLFFVGIQKSSSDEMCRNCYGDQSAYFAPPAPPFNRYYTPYYAPVEAPPNRNYRSPSDGYDLESRSNWNIPPPVGDYAHYPRPAAYPPYQSYPQPPVTTGLPQNKSQNSESSSNWNDLIQLLLKKGININLNLRLIDDSYNPEPTATPQDKDDSFLPVSTTPPPTINYSSSPVTVGPLQNDDYPSQTTTPVAYTNLNAGYFQSHPLATQSIPKRSSPQSTPPTPNEHNPLEPFQPFIGRAFEQRIVTPNDGECYLPSYFPNGAWTFINPPSNSSYNTTVPEHSVLTLSCNSGYKLDGGSTVLCLRKEWSPSIGRCTRTCPSIRSTKTMKVRCVYKDQETEDCVESREGTLAYFKCKSFYEDNRLLKPKAMCIDGKWSEEVPKCTPICGRATIQERPTLIVEGDKTKKGEFPWQIALYTVKDKTLQCGGSLLSEKVVLTAAHCITDNYGRVLPTTEYVVAAGKYYRQFDHPEDAIHSQIVPIEKMFVSEEYAGEDLEFAGDIAIIVTEFNIRFTTRVQPVCIDWLRSYEHKIIDSNDEKGYVSGWGYTRENSSPANELRSLRVPSLARKDCRNLLPEDYRRYMTFDKFCAGYRNNGTSVCGGDSGGGLVFKRDGRFYIAGVVSLSPRAPTQEGGCDSQQYSLYTLIYNYTDNFILSKLIQHKPQPDNTCRFPVDSYQYSVLQKSEDYSSDIDVYVPFGTTIKVKCDSGYEYQGPDNVTCSKEGWSVPFGSCLRNRTFEWTYPPDMTTVGPQPDNTCDFPVWNLQYSVVQKSKNYSSSIDRYVPFGTIIKAECPGKDIYNRANDIIECNEKGWSTSIGYCRDFNSLELCPPLHNSTKAKVSCTYKNKIIENCAEPFDETVAKFECAPFYELATVDTKPSVCLRGQWYYLPECVPACGQAPSNPQGKYPWTVGIYKKSDKHFVCEGSLINTKIIITAAHCVTDSTGNLLSPEDYVVAAGKQHRQYHHPEDVHAQYSEIDKTLIPKQYNTQNYQGDVAMIITEKSFVLSGSVLPVCVDWDTNRAVGWGFSKSFEAPTQQNFTIVSGKHCADAMEEEFKDYLTEDKLCAVSSSNFSQCASGGLVIKEDNKHYLVGVSTSLSDSSERGTCDTPYALFTKISSYVNNFILETVSLHRN